MRPATPAFIEGLFVVMAVSAPPTTDNTLITTAMDAAQEPERWDGMS